MRHVGLALLAGLMTVLASPAAANQLPQAQLGPLGSDYRAGTPACLDASGSTDGDGQIIQYAWEFGDGATAAGPAASSCHTYTGPGSYIVRLVVTDDQGATASVIDRIAVRSVAPIAAFALSATNNAQERQFAAQDSRDPDGAIVAYDWSFGDGTTASGVNPLHRFPAPGTYTVTLKVTDSSGETASTTQSVAVVLSPPTATLDAGAADCAGERHALNVAGADSDGHVVDVRWDLDGKPGFELDTQTATGVAAVFSSGRHHVAVRVTDDSGLTADAAADLTFRPCRLSVKAPRELHAGDRRVVVVVSCAVACALDAEVMNGAHLLARGLGHLRSAGTTDVRVDLDAAARRRLRTLRSVRVDVHVSALGGSVVVLRRRMSVHRS